MLKTFLRRPIWVKMGDIPGWMGDIPGWMEDIPGWRHLPTEFLLSFNKTFLLPGESFGRNLVSGTFGAPCDRDYMWSVPFHVTKILTTYSPKYYTSDTC